MGKSSKTTEKRGWLAEFFLKKDVPLYTKVARTGLLIILAILLSLPLLPGTAALLPGRDMSDAERALLRPIFKNAVQYDKVKIHQSVVADRFLQLSGGDTLAVNLREIFGSVLHGKGLSSRYDYALGDGKKLEDYGVEQQASIIADYYRMKKGNGPYYLTNQIARGQDAMLLYDAVLVDFLKDPAYLSQVCHPQTP